MGLELFPHWVDMDHARGAIPQVDSIIKEIWLFEELTPNGATGVPSKATAGKGKCMADTVVDYIAGYLNGKRKRHRWVRPQSNLNSPRASHICEKPEPVTPSRLLIINPNTTAGITALLEAAARGVATATTAHIRAVTARFGAPYISCEASYAVAGHATLDAWAAALAPPAPMPETVLIGCFGDPGLLALRELSAVPVTGLAEASFIEASRHGRFAIVTGGRRWKPMLERLAHSLGYGELLAGVQTLDATGSELAANPNDCPSSAGRFLPDSSKRIRCKNHHSRRCRSCGNGSAHPERS